MPRKASRVQRALTVIVRTFQLRPLRQKEADSFEKVKPGGDSYGRPVAPFLGFNVRTPCEKQFDGVPTVFLGGVQQGSKSGGVPCVDGQSLLEQMDDHVRLPRLGGEVKQRHPLSGHVPIRGTCRHQQSDHVQVPRGTGKHQR